MNAPDFDHGYLRIPLTVWREVYCQAPLTRRQLQIVSVVLRESWGWQRRDGTVCLWTRPLPSRQLAQLTGLSTDHMAGDLRDLIACGVLRENSHRYQLVPEARLWKTPAARVPKSRPPAPKCLADAAETALRPVASKKTKIRQRNVPIAPRIEFSPSGDKSGPADPTNHSHTAVGLATAGLASRFVAIIQAYAGPLSEAQIEQLRQWVQEAGVAAVWNALQPAFGQGPAACRTRLAEFLPDRATTTSGSDRDRDGRQAEPDA